MKTVILVGGKGARIQEVENNSPKCLINIGPYPILEHIMQHYYRHKQNDFILCLGYQGQLIKQHFLNYGVRTQDFSLNLVNFNEKQEVKYCQRFLIGKRHETEPYIPDYNIIFAETGLDNSKIKRLLLIEDYIHFGECFLLTYGDGISNVDITKLIAFHESHGKIGTITAIMPKDRFGRLEIDHGNDNQIKGFYEKPQTFEWINGGFMIFKTVEFFELLEKLMETLKPVDLETDFLPYLSSKKELHAFIHDGYWQQMDTPKDYETLQKDYQKGEF